MHSPALPSPSAPREHHADWLELRALIGSHGVSIREVVRDFKIGGVVDSRDDWQQGHSIDDDEDEIGEALAEAVFDEIYERKLASGDAYPFEINSEHIQLREGMDQGVYSFLALLSKYGKDAGPPGENGAKLFEDVCAKAIERYLGGDHPDVQSYAFGFPRRTLPKAFPAALDELCKVMGEGVKSRGDQPISSDQKDAKLDIVAWREFADRRQGKLIVFGQCATGGDWQQKRTELPAPVQWCQLWMHRIPYVHPIRLFCVPHRVEHEEWERTCTLGGLLFDRCRIAYHTANIDDTIAATCATWSNHVLQEMRNQ